MLRNWSGVGGGTITLLALARMLDATQLVWGGWGGDDNIPCTCTQGGWGGDDNIPCTCTHVGCYATGEVETARGASKIAGTQCVDRLCQSLKRFCHFELAAKDPKTKTISTAFGHMIYSFAWRKSLGPRTGPQFLDELCRIW